MNYKKKQNPLKLQLQEANKVIKIVRTSVGAGYNPAAYKALQEYFKKYGGKK